MASYGATAEPLDSLIDPMRTLSVTRVLPTPDAPQSGVFVERRLAAIAARMPLRVLQPVPYFPGVRPLPGCMV